MNFLKKIFGIEEQNEYTDPEFDQIVREAKRQVEINRKIGSIILAVIILIVGLYVHFFWEKPDKDSITVRLTVDVSELKDDTAVTLSDELPSGGIFVNNNTFVIKEDGTVADLLNRFSEKREIPVDLSGKEVRAIGGIEKYEYGNYRWVVSVNGEEKDGDPAGIVLKNTEGVTIRYTQG